MRAHSPDRSIGLCSLVLAAVALVMSTSCATEMAETGSSRADGADRSSSVAPRADGRAAKERLFYLQGTRVHRLGLDSRNDAVVADLDTKDVFASAHSPWLAYVATDSRSRDTEVDFVERPVLHLFNVTTKRDITVGPGVAPTWGPGAEMAYLRPVEERGCSGERCTGRSELVVHDAVSGSEEVLLPPGRWGVLGWLGERVLVANADRLQSTLVVGRGVQTMELDLSPSSIWAGSPDGRWLLTVEGDSAEFVQFEDGAVGAGTVGVPLRGAVLAEGRWSTDSTRVAAALFDRRGLESELVVFGPSSARPTRIGRVQPVGSVLWSPSMTSLVAVVRGRSGGLRAVRCPPERAVPCSTLLRWRRGIALLSVR